VGSAFPRIEPTEAGSHTRCRPLWLPYADRSVQQDVTHYRAGVVTSASRSARLTPNQLETLLQRLSAIEILPGVRGHLRPLRLVARQTPYYSNDSHWWSPDNYFAGGQLASYTTPVTGTDDPELFESERWGNFSYAIPVAQGKYTVTLFFAARHGSPGELLNSESKSTEAAHIFNVFCNGQAILQAFDPVKEAGQSDVVVRKFVGLEPNAQGKILLSFVPVEGYATVTGIEVLPL